MKRMAGSVTNGKNIDSERPALGYNAGRLSPRRGRRVLKIRFWRQRLYRKVIRLKASKISVARGMALGVIFGSLMPPGLQLVTGIPVTFLLGGNPFAMIAGTFISNPVTYIPLYTFNCRVGALFFGLFDPTASIGEDLELALRALKSFDLLSPVSSFVHVFDTLKPFLAYWISGGLIIGLAAAVPMYYITYLAVIEVHKLRDFSLARRQARRDRHAARAAEPERCPAGDPDEEAPDEQPPPPV